MNNYPKTMKFLEEAFERQTKINWKEQKTGLKGIRLDYKDSPDVQDAVASILDNLKKATKSGCTNTIGMAIKIIEEGITF